MNNTHKSKKGFTLIEMLIVIAIIGILSSILLVGLGAFRGRGRDARRISDLRQVQNALELYFNQTGTYPATSDWNSLRTTLVGANIGISTISGDPTTGRSYGYCSPDGTEYVLGAVLEDAGNPTLRDQENTSFSCTPNTVPATACHDSTNGSAGYCITL
jgi:prepilin-type N-terminal cleavage/methylation domain-containing protein